MEDLRGWGEMILYKEDMREWGAERYLYKEDLREWGAERLYLYKEDLRGGGNSISIGKM